MVTYILKHFTEKCGRTAADKDMVTIDSLGEVVSALSDGSIADPHDLPFSHNTFLTDKRTDDDSHANSSTVT